MDRGKPLQRRTPLTSTTGLQPGTSRLTRGGPLAAKSAKRQADDRVRARVVAALRRAQRVTVGYEHCQRCGARGRCDAHELLSRARGGSITDPGNIALLCRGCHDLVTFHHHEIPDADRWLISAYDQRGTRTSDSNDDGAHR